jgi:signal transduction histidine kinase/GGDEF domain-containing protein
MAFLEGKSILSRKGVEMKNRILVVDDEEEIGVLLYQALSRMGGFFVEVVRSGEEALQKIEKEPFDLVLTDLKMPKMDGLQLVSKIAQAKPEILLVLMSGHGSIDSALEGMKKGASDYLTKPLNLDELVVRLHKVLDEKQRFLSLKDYTYELERANKELRKIDEIKSEFVSVASHELRTPLAAIKNSVQLMISGKTGEINENQAKFLSMAERNINRLTNILNDLLNLSRIESGKIDVKFEELDVRNPIEFVVSSLKPQADGKSVCLRTEMSQQLPSVYGDREKLEQILTNLLGNAIKFTPEGGEVVVSAQPLNALERKLAISVRDTGIGIPKDQSEKIFEKFHQVEGSLHRSVSGTGLGLAITKGLVEANYGTIWVESEVGKGSTFTFTLPMSKGERRDLRFRSMLDREFQRAKENQSPLTLFLIEIWEEKIDVKDALLDQLEVQVKQCLCRKGDITLRRQKEKILAVLCEADLKGAQAVRQRIEGEIQKCAMNQGDQSPIIKVGVATYPAEVFSKRELFRLAKERLGG